MTPTRPTPAAGEHGDDLDAVRQALSDVGAEAGGAALAAHAGGGKLLRAHITLLVCRLGAPDRARARRLAVALELLHAGGLCHDDVVDGSLVRRGHPTIEATHGTRAAALGGLCLMLRGLAAVAGEPEALRRTVARALRDVARGQTDEGLDLFDAALAPEAYLRRAQAKTGALYELAGRLGAAAGELSGLSLDRAAAYAAAFGMAFQLGDDLRDLLGGAALGRAPGTDLRQGVYTFPVLLTLSGRHPGAEALRRLLSQGDGALAACVALLRANGALAETERLAGEYVEQALASLAVFPASAARQGLEALARGLHAPARGGEPPAARPATARRRPAIRPVPAHYLLAVDDDLAACLAILNQRFQLGLPATTLGTQGWVDSVATVTALGVALLWLSDRIVDATPAASAGAAARNAALVGACDLAVAALAGLLANLPAAVARGVMGSLARRVTRAVVLLFADQTCSIRLDDVAICELADEVTAAAARSLGGEGARGG
jgi:geranylgeranyl pyrophosphate synthase